MSVTKLIVKKNASDGDAFFIINCSLGGWFQMLIYMSGWPWKWAFRKMNMQIIENKMNQIKNPVNEEK